MKRTLKYCLTGILLTAICTASAVAQQKIATISLVKVFDNYYKTKIAQKQLDVQKTEFKDNLDGLMADYQNLNTEYKDLREKANDQIISAAERDKRMKEAEGKLQQIRDLEGNLKQFQQTMQTTLMEKQRRLTSNVVREIREVVAQKAKAAGYTLVIDSSAQTGVETMVVMYTDNSADLTDDVLATLNANAPAEFKESAN